MVAGCGDADVLADECMYESLRSSKSIVIFSNEMGRDLFNQTIIKALCQSGKLLSILDKPEEYNLLIVDVVEKNSHGPGCGRDALEAFAFDYEQMEQERKDRMAGIQEAFTARVQAAIANRSLWPHLQDMEMTEKITQKEQDFYRGKIETVASKLKYFDAYPVTFCGLRNLNVRQVRDVMMNDAISKSKFSLRQLMEMTSVPALIDKFREILIEGSVSVRDELKNRLESISMDLVSMEEDISAGHPGLCKGLQDCSAMERKGNGLNLAR